MTFLNGLNRKSLPAKS
ncbi:hypothetical protein BpHYR1_047399 [Brachionus plicatilis]|uniref:Uncharacterized protein n=1 Tax=Brachionus plicatilis TaxID=10195 RepID=A0A3M7T692_BRAPC|nr:hypothetical protein BpHYR1_047399 [Brachionus plicatilis]